MAARRRVDTDELIGQLATDVGAPRPHAMALRLFVGVAVPGAIVLAILLGAFTHSSHLAHFGRSISFSLGAALALAVPAFVALLLLSRPDADLRARFIWLPGALILAVGIGAELMAAPRYEWLPRLMGTNPAGCFLSVLGLSLPILGGIIWALRQGAPARPAMSGALAGLLAGGITAALYLVHCPEDSLLFTLAWHVPALVIVAVLGATAGHRLLRW